MLELNLRFEITQEYRADELAEELQKRLGKLENVREVDAIPEGEWRLSGAEIAGAVAVTVLIIRGGREMIEEIRKLVVAIKALSKEINGIRDVSIGIGTQQIPVGELSEEQLEQLSE